jgi:hypothetical protein
MWWIGSFWALLANEIGTYIVRQWQLLAWSTLKSKELLKTLFLFHIYIIYVM